MKKVFYVLAALVVLYVILAFAGPAEVSVVRTTSIKTTQADAMKALGDFKHFHENWSPWTDLEPDMKTSYLGEPGTVGHKYRWEGTKDSVGVGEMILDSVFENRVVQTVHFIKPMESYAKSWFTADAKADSVLVSWGMSFEIGFFMRPFMLFMNWEEMLGPSFENGLLKLKTTLETNKNVYRGYKVEEIEWTMRYYQGIKGKLKMAELNDFFSTNFAKVSELMAKAKVEPSGPLASMYFLWNEATGDVECAAVAPVTSDVKVPGLQLFTLSNTRALKVVYFGAPEKSMDAYYAIDDYMKANNLKDTLVVEEYMVDFKKEPDTTKWQTNIYFILK